MWCFFLVKASYRCQMFLDLIDYRGVQDKHRKYLADERADESLSAGGWPGGCKWKWGVEPLREGDDLK